MIYTNAIFLDQSCVTMKNEKFNQFYNELCTNICKFRENLSWKIYKKHTLLDTRKSNSSVFYILYKYFLEGTFLRKQNVRTKTYDRLLPDPWMCVLGSGNHGYWTTSCCATASSKTDWYYRNYREWSPPDPGHLSLDSREYWFNSQMLVG